MNANELADKLMSSLTMEYDCDKYMEQAATILRQQQAELDAFKLQYYNTGYSLQLRDKDETIRQQQAEIEALKKDNKELHGIAQRMAMAESDARKSLQWFKDAKERQSEPVAIVNTNCENNIQWNVLKPQSYNGYFLYTHPAKTLTDEEILQTWKEFDDNDADNWFIEIARAILRKAQEK